MADLIDRKATMESITAEYNRKGTGDGLRLAWIEKAVNSVPSVSPQQKVGRWIYVQYDGNPNIGNWHCSECNRIVCGAMATANQLLNAYRFCPNCGAKMAESEVQE